MARPKSAKRKEADLRFRADLLLRLRIKRLSLFYGGNASALMSNRIVLHAQNEERRLDIPTTHAEESPLAPKYNTYEALPTHLKSEVDQLSKLIAEVLKGADEKEVLVKLDALYPQTKAVTNQKPIKKKAPAKAKRARLLDISWVSLGIFDTIPAGRPEERCTIKPLRTVRVRKGLYPPDAFGLVVSGDSMNAATGKFGAILDGETVVLGPYQSCEDSAGKIVAALVDGQTTLKRLERLPDGRCILMAETTNRKIARSIDPAHDLQIQGVVIGKF